MKPLPFRVKSKWQPPPQPSVALETYLELTKTDLSNIVHRKYADNLTKYERRALKELSANKEINLKKADKGTTTVIMNTNDKIEEGLLLVSEEKHYKVVNRLFSSCHINKITHQWLKDNKTSPRIPEFYTLTKIHKKVPVGRPIVSGTSGPTERISCFVDSLCNRLQKHKSLTSKKLLTLSTLLRKLPYQTRPYLPL